MQDIMLLNFNRKTLLFNNFFCCKYNKTLPDEQLYKELMFGSGSLNTQFFK